MRRLIFLLSLLAVSMHTSTEAQTTPSEFAQQRINLEAELLRYDVVVVQTDTQQGYGLIVGVRAGKYLIALPKHILQLASGQLATAARITFFVDDRARSIQAGTLVGSSNTEDIAFIQTAKPPAHVLGPETKDDLVEPGDFVNELGQGGDWTSAPSAGQISATQPGLVIDGLTIEPGYSGATVISVRGIVGLIRARATQKTGYLISIRSIENTFTQEASPLGWQWILQNGPPRAAIGYVKMTRGDRLTELFPNSVRLVRVGPLSGLFLLSEDKLAPMPAGQYVVSAVDTNQRALTCYPMSVAVAENKINPLTITCSISVIGLWHGAGVSALDIEEDTPEHYSAVISGVPLISGHGTATFDGRYLQLSMYTAGLGSWSARLAATPSALSGRADLSATSAGVTDMPLFFQR
jgi:hypothetical protein